MMVLPQLIIMHHDALLRPLQRAPHAAVPGRGANALKNFCVIDIHCEESNARGWRRLAIPALRVAVSLCIGPKRKLVSTTIRGLAKEAHVVNCNSLSERPLAAPQSMHGPNVDGRYGASSAERRVGDRRPFGAESRSPAPLSKFL